MDKILSMLLAIIIGCGGVMALFYSLNFLVDLLPAPRRPQLRPWVYLFPAIFVLLAYLVIPTLNTIYLSFLDGSSQKFVGFNNYVYAFTNPTLLIAFRNNLGWLILVTSFSVGLGLILAVLMDKVKYEPFAKSLIFLPMAISFVGAGVIWRFIYAFRPINTPQIGLLNAIVTAFGFEPIGWLVNRSINNFALMFIMIWLQTGFCTVLISAAVKGIPPDIIEAARIDGANEWQIFWRITVPMIRSTLAVVATTVIIVVLKVFDIVFVMTGGNHNTQVIASEMIKEMFNFRHFGRGSAIAVILLIAVIPVMVSNIRRFTEQESSR